MRLFSLYIAAASCSSALAATWFSASAIANWDQALRFSIAENGSPMFHFAQANGNPMCYPTWPFRPDGSKRPAQGQSNWPKTGPCKQMDLNKRGWGEKMPVYYTIKRCGGDEVRVGYSVFWEKDGFVGNGHNYDWENVVVIWRRNGDKFWKDSIKISQHKGWSSKSWNDIPQTVDGGNWFESGARGKDHPKIYVGWCKHAMFFEKRTQFSTIVACLDGTEMRSDDWYYVAVNSDDLISANINSAMDAKFRANDWGDAWSKPDRIYDSLCNI